MFIIDLKAKVMYLIHFSVILFQTLAIILEETHTVSSLAVVSMVDNAAQAQHMLSMWASSLRKVGSTKKHSSILQLQII